MNVYIYIDLVFSGLAFIQGQSLSTATGGLENRPLFFGLSCSGKSRRWRRTNSNSLANWCSYLPTSQSLKIVIQVGQWILWFNFYIDGLHWRQYLCNHIIKKEFWATYNNLTPAHEATGGWREPSPNDLNIWGKGISHVLSIQVYTTSMHSILACDTMMFLHGIFA